MFSAWASEVHERVRKRNLLNRYKTRWLNLCAASAFNAWCDYIDMRHRTRQLMQLTLTRLSNASLLRALVSWRLAARWGASEEERYDLSPSTSRRRISRYRKRNKGVRT